ncbi:uncharacterized protein [Typha latifolia]|uniref:uncharacterized protein isoform X2 n=1 Tax=Typha latifolia TaxID=4733 RepID=UPI003C30795F
MASAAAAINQAASPKPVDDSLWWDSFVLLFEELDRVPLSDDLPDHLVKVLRSNHPWFLDSVSRFKPPDEASRLALESTDIIVGSNRLGIRSEIKEAALRICKCLSLDEVQSYILIERSSEFNISVVDVEDREFLHLVLLRYYLERQCLLKCVRRILVHALYASNGSAIRREALQLVNNGLEKRLIAIFEDLLSTVFSVRNEAEFTVLWVEETLIEETLILDILFLIFYDNFSTCSVGQWKTLCSLFKGMLCGPFDVGKLAVTVEAKNTFCHAKAQLLLILIETLDLENLLRMVHDEVPFREGFSAFSLSDIQEIDAEVSSLSELRIVESGPLVLAWAVFLCLLSSLPESTTSLFMEIDHTGYVRQAFEVAPFRYSMDILCSDTMREADGPVSGFLSIFRTLLSAFIASYELSLQTEDNYLSMILDILCQIYRCEESLCMQFWDKDSFVDGPIRSLLYMLEKEYPLQTVEFIRFLSAVCEGSWAAQCVYDYLEKMSSITTLYEIPDDSVAVNIHHLIKIDYQMTIPGIEGHVIPNGTHGHVLKVIGENAVLVRWECAHSGILLFLFKLVQGLHSYNFEEVYHIVDLLCRLISTNKALCLSLLHAEKSLAVGVSKELGQIEKDVRIDVVNIICTSMFNLIQDVNNISVVSNFFKMLAEFLNCAPSHVFELAMKSPVFATEINGPSSGSWFLSCGLAKMFFAACEEERDCCLLTTSVLDFIIQVLEKGAEDSVLSALIEFFLQFVLVNHMHWKYKKHSRWKATLKILELLRSCIKTIPVSSTLGGVIQDILLYDSSVHNILLRIMFMSTQSLEMLYASHHRELKEIEDLHLVICLALDIVHSMLAALSEESFTDQPAFVNMVLSSASKPMPFITAVTSLVSFFHNPAIQAAASRVFSKICFIASRIQSMENANLVADAMQNSKLRAAIYCILEGKKNQDDTLIVSMFNLLHSAACYQPALLVSLILKEENAKTELNANGNTDQLAASPVIQISSSKDAKLIDLIMKYIERSKDLFNSFPRLLLSVLDLLKAFWEGGLQYVDILERIRSTKNFWENLSACISSIPERNVFPVGSRDDDDSQYISIRYLCQGTVLEIMACELFLQKRLQDEKPAKTTRSLDGQIRSSNMLDSEGILKTWCNSSIMEALIKSYSSTGYDRELVRQAKVVVCLCIVHLITKVSTGDMGSLSMPLVKQLHVISTKLSQHPAFSALLSQYSFCGYSGRKELSNLVMNDLYYHLQGELEGREITSGPFQELLHFLLSLEAFQNEERRKDKSSSQVVKDSCMFDVLHIRRELGIDLWCYSGSGWTESKEIAEKMLMIIHNANLMMSVSASKHFALKSLIAALSVYMRRSDEWKPKLLVEGMSDQLVLSGIRYVCKTLQETVDSAIPHSNTNEVLLQFLSAHVELLLTLTRIHFEQRKCRREFFPILALLIKTSGSVIQILSDIRPFNLAPNKVVKLLLMLLLTSLRFTYSVENMKDEPDLELNLFSEVSISSIGVLPVLCKYAENSEYSNPSVASLDLMLKGYLTPNIWFPVLQKHLRLQVILRKVLMKDASVSAHVIFNFCLTLARTKDGAKMLHLADIFSSLKVLLSQLNIGDPLLSDGTSSISQGKHVHLWRLGLAIMTSVIYCIGDDSYMDIVDNSIHFLSEKAHIIFSFSLSAPNVPVDDQSKNRGILQKSKTSLGDLNLTEHTLMLICELAKHHALWSMGMKEIASGLNETIIHLLAFISKGNLRGGESSNYNLHFECPPTVKEEVDFDEIPSAMKSKQGWFSLSLCSMRNATVSDQTHAGLPLVNKDQANEDSDLVWPTFFTNMVATQIYKIAFLILKFLCMQAKAAVKRAVEVAFIDLAHFPELPMPEILHGLQDQTTAIITEMCEGNRSKCLPVETENVCLLLLQILEKSVYLEFCVSQSCGIRPVLGRIEDFSKEIKAMMHVAEQHSKFKSSLKSLKQIIALQYPELLHH